MSTVRVPQPTDPRRAPARPRQRPDLRVVGRPRRGPGRRGVVVGLAIVVVFLALLASAAFHAVLAQGQQRLDNLNSEVTQQQQRYEHLRYQVATLSAPQTIVGAATKLGMVQPEQRTLLTPASGTDAAASGPSAGGGPAPGDSTSAPEPTPWALYPEIKPYLGAGR